MAHKKQKWYPPFNFILIFQFFIKLIWWCTKNMALIKLKKPKAKTRKEPNLTSEFPLFSNRKEASAINISPTIAYHIKHADLHIKLYESYL